MFLKKKKKKKSFNKYDTFSEVSAMSLLKIIGMIDGRNKGNIRDVTVLQQRYLERKG